MQHSPVLRRLSAVAVLALAAACGGDSPSGPNPPTPVPPTPSPSPDTEAPTVSYVSPAADTTVAQAGVTVQGKASDNVGVSRVTYTVDGGGEQDVTITAGTSPTFQFTVQGLSEGSHTLVLRAYDAADNRGEAGRKVTYVRQFAYTLAVIPLLSGTVAATPFGLSEDGRVAGAARNGAGSPRPFTWRSSQLTALPLLPGHITGRANAVNSAGQSAGYSSTSADQVVDPGDVFRAILWQNGQASDLGDLGGGTAVAQGINQDGVVVGASTRSAGIVFKPFLWDGSMRELPTLGGANGGATDVNRARQVVGGADDAQGRTRAFLWQNNLITDLGSLTSDGTSTALAINEAGQIAGYSGRETSSQRAFLWENGTMRDLGSLEAGAFAAAGDVNASGVVVGTTKSGSGSTGFRWSNGIMEDLNALMAPGSGFTIVFAIQINDAGQIAAEAVESSSGQRRTVLLTPNPTASASVNR